MPSFRHFALLYKEQGLCYSKRMSKNNEKTILTHRRRLSALRRSPHI